jgi:hypothetical protein
MNVLMPILAPILLLLAILGLHYQITRGYHRAWKQFAAMNGLVFTPGQFYGPPLVTGNMSVIEGKYQGYSLQICVWTHHWNYSGKIELAVPNPLRRSLVLERGGILERCGSTKELSDGFRGKSNPISLAKNILADQELGRRLTSALPEFTVCRRVLRVTPHGSITIRFTRSWGNPLGTVDALNFCTDLLVRVAHFVNDSILTSKLEGSGPGIRQKTPNGIKLSGRD